MLNQSQDETSPSAEPAITQAAAGTCDTITPHSPVCSESLLEFESTDVSGATARSPIQLSVVEAFDLVRSQPALIIKNSIDQEPDNSFQDTVTAEKPVTDLVINSTEPTDLPPSDMASLPLDELADFAPTETPLARIDWTHPSPKLMAYVEKDYKLSPPNCATDNYLRGCLWAPDGSCILTNSRDNILRLFNLPKCLFDENWENASFPPEEMTAVLTMRDHELVYDYAWYPGMCSSEPTTCCFASTVRRNPIRLWDAFTGEIRATYRPINHLGEPVSAYSIAFSADGQRLYAGFSRFMHVFNVSRPGRDSVRRPRLGKKPTQGGIISCIAVPRHSGRQIYATGSYNGSVVVYAEPGNPIIQLYTGSAGVTQVQFTSRVGHESGSPWYLAAGSRMDSRVFLWDARQTKEPLLVLHRRVENHQRFQFDFDPMCEFMFTGSQTGAAYVYDLSACLKNYQACQRVIPSLVWRAHLDCAHGLSVNPTLPIVATSSGQRRIEPPPNFRPGHRIKRSRKEKSSVDSEERTSFSPGPPTGCSADESHPDTGDSSSSDSCSSLCEAELTDDEASLILPDETDESCMTDLIVGARSLPMYGKLTRLPRENRLCLWSFPTVTSEMDKSAT